MFCKPSEQLFSQEAATQLPKLNQNMNTSCTDPENFLGVCVWGEGGGGGGGAPNSQKGSDGKFQHGKN